MKRQPRLRDDAGNEIDMETGRIMPASPDFPATPTLKPPNPLAGEIWLNPDTCKRFRRDARGSWVEVERQPLPGGGTGGGHLIWDGEKLVGFTTKPEPSE